MATTQQKLEQGRRSREALLSAAIELIADGGYNATGVDAIARRSGVMKSALYWHFGSKEGLLVAALERSAAEWVAELEQSMVPDAAPGARLRDLVDRVQGLFVERPDRIRLLMSALIERGDSNEEVRKGVARILEQIQAAIARGIHAALPPIPEARVAGLAELILAALAGAFVETFADPDPARFDRRMKLIAKMIRLFATEELREARAAAS